jgi:hypothetical protein
LILFRQNSAAHRRFVISHIVIAAFVVLSLTGSSSAAQGLAANDPHRWAVAATLDVGGLPDDFANQCSYPTNGGAPAVGGGLTVLRRFHRWMLAAVDTRVTGAPIEYGCKLVVPAPVQIGPNEYENSGGRQLSSGVPSRPLVQNAVQFGVETPSGYWPLRATVGAGEIWSAHQTPFATLTVGGGSRGRGVRFYWALEGTISRVHVREVHTRYRVDSTTTTQLAPRVVLYDEHPRWAMLHLGMEFPLVLRE